jgi:hypothetical protein
VRVLRCMKKTKEIYERGYSVTHACGLMADDGGGGGCSSSSSSSNSSS